MNSKKAGKGYKKETEERHAPKKKYGQNFLKDEGLSEKILEVSGIGKKDEVIEIGPGLGFLTGGLIERCRRLIAFEIDDGLIPLLSRKFQGKDNFLLVHGDFMEVDLKGHIGAGENIKVVANIPYYITSPIIKRLIGHRNNISEIYLMVQKEVAERIASQPASRNMGLLTHGVQFYAEAEYLFTVPKEKFEPIPKVDSAFISIKIFKDRKHESQISEEKYFRYLKSAFSNKRKSIANNLSGIGLDKTRIGDLLEKAGKTRMARVEEFSVQEFIDFIKMLEKG